MIQTQVSINHTGVLLCESYRSNVSFCFSSFSYLAYFNLASAIVRIDAPTETHNIGRDQAVEVKAFIMCYIAQYKKNEVTIADSNKNNYDNKINNYKNDQNGRE